MSTPADAAKSWLENADRMHRDYGVPPPVNYQLVTELVAELEAVRLEADLAHGGAHVRPMTETESNLMTQVLDLRRKIGAIRERCNYTPDPSLVDEILAILDAPRSQCLRCGNTEPHQCARPKENR